MSDLSCEDEIENQEKIYRLAADDAMRMMKSGPQGLTKEEAAARQKKFGKNVIAEKKGKPVILIFLANFTSLMAILLWVGGIIAFAAEMPELGFAIWLVNVINGVFSFVQEARASKATEALKNMLSSYARVLRDGAEQQVLTEDLVPGDVIVIAEGDKISADARLLESSDLQVDQSTLTGESNPVRKTHDPVLMEDLSRSEVPNMIFAGTSVASGAGKAVIETIGMNTMFGNIADLTQSMGEAPSPLQKELDKLTRNISILALGLGILFFIAAVFFVKDPVAESFIFALGMVVAFIPEGLLPTVTLSLAMAVQRMAKEHALVKKLSAVETLGCTTVICSDKTGTLTQNEMTVRDLWLPGQELEVTGLGYAPDGEIKKGDTVITAAMDSDLKILLTGLALCSNARIIPPAAGKDRYTVLGDPTEACLGVVAGKAGIDVKQQTELTPRIRELPFDSRRKRMTTIHQLDEPIEGATRIAYVKGAPKETMELCSTISKCGRKETITDDDRKEIMTANDCYARKGLRVLALAYRMIKNDDELPKMLSDYTPELVERELVFVGLVVMADPPRPEVAEAVKRCNRANIRIIMITGDYGLTAESIAKRIGIVKGEYPQVISGIELEKLQDEQLKEVLKGEVIFARVAPEQKYRVVSMLQEMDEIVAVTGDGVNDAPALKKADIGVAMGIAGTDVAKEAADMILTDDNFASIVKAIEEGRGVYRNIKRFITYILTSNMSEATPSAAFLFSRGLIPLPLTVMQILTIDLGTDMLPALGLGTELPEKGIMDIPPRNRNDSLMDKKVVFKAFFWYGALEAIFSFIAYLFVNVENGWPDVPLAGSGDIYVKATTMTLAAIIFGQVGAVMNCRTEFQSIFKVGLFSNKRVTVGIAFEICLMMALIYLPVLQGAFQTGPIGWKDWLFLMLIPIPMILLEEARKAIIRYRKAKNGRGQIK